MKVTLILAGKLFLGDLVRQIWLWYSTLAPTAPMAAITAETEDRAMIFGTTMDKMPTLT